MPTPRSRITVLAAFAVTAAVPCGAGCTRVSGNSDAGGSLGVPPSGQVRVVARRIEQTADRVHWKWSVIGERNWETPVAQGPALSLEGTYALNDAGANRQGCNIYEADLVATRDAKGGPARWKLTLHGSDGDTATSEGELPSGAAARNAVKITQDADALLSLPADVPLATVDGKPVTLRIPR